MIVVRRRLPQGSVSVIVGVLLSQFIKVALLEGVIPFALLGVEAPIRKKEEIQPFLPRLEKALSLLDEGIATTEDNIAGPGFVGGGLC